LKKMLTRGRTQRRYAHGREQGYGFRSNNVFDLLKHDHRTISKMVEELLKSTVGQREGVAAVFRLPIRMRHD